MWVHQLIGILPSNTANCNASSVFLFSLPLFGLAVLTTGITASPLSAKTLESLPINQANNLNSPEASISNQQLNSQSIDLAQTSPAVSNPPPQNVIPRDFPPSTSVETPSVPKTPLDNLLNQLQTSPSLKPDKTIPGSLTVKHFKFEGSKVFGPEKLAEEIQLCFLKESPEKIQICPSEEAQRERKLIKKPLSAIRNQKFTFTQLLQIAAEVAKFYAKNGYSTSGAIVCIPPKGMGVSTKGMCRDQQQETLRPTNQGNNVVTIKVIEGKLEDIKLYQQDLECGSKSAKNPRQRLNCNYVRSRLGVKESETLNVDELREALLLLQLDPLIKNVSATLSHGSETGKSILEVRYSKASSLDSQFSISNSRAPSVGSFQRQVVLREANLLGFGDSLSLGYSNTDGSDGLDVSYTLPLNPSNGTLRFSYTTTSNGVIEPPFDDLDQNGFGPDITSASRSYEVALRQPLIRTIRGRQNPNFSELALGLTASLRESDSSVLGEPFSLSPGASEDGITRIFALRFFQDWTKQNRREVIAFRSQFSLGLDAFNSTTNEQIPGVEAIPDSRFFSWLGQAQYLRLLDSQDPYKQLLVRANVQLADQPLTTIEQFAIGGFGSVRGYRQDTIIADNGIFASAEIQLPIVRVFQGTGVIQLIPFIDAGIGWNNSGRANPDPSTLASLGFGLQWQQSNNFTARLDWGIPLVSVDSRSRTWQENGLYFSLRWNPF